MDHRTRVGKERSARTESKILGAALVVFSERGPEAPVIEDFVKAAGIARGTFYNYFKSVDELLVATSKWMTRELIRSIQQSLGGIEGPTLRLGLGLRLFFARAQRDPVWSRFVARVWNIGGIDVPLRDLEAGVRLGHFRVSSCEAARDLLLGGIRAALARIGAGRVASSYGDEMTEICLYALRADPRRIAAVLEHELPSVGEETNPRRDRATEFAAEEPRVNSASSPVAARESNQRRRR